jgi:hypothetical protein
MARKQQKKGLVQTAAVLAATALIETAVKKAAARAVKATTRKISKKIKRRRSTRS